MMTRLFWPLLAAMLAVYATMLIGTLPHLAQLAGGARVFDLRPTGYGFDEAHSLIAALGEEGRAYYLGVQHKFDTAFPALKGAVLVALFRWMYRGMFGLVCAAIALAAMVCDYLENAAVTVMLRAGPEALTPETVADANGWTLAKSALDTVSMTLVFVGFGLMLWRRFRG